MPVIFPTRFLLGIAAAARTPSIGQTLAVEDLPLDFAETERLPIERPLDMAGGNVTRTARMLGIDSNKVYRIPAKARG